MTSPEVHEDTGGSPRFDLSLIIACYNEEGHLAESVAEIVATMAITTYSYELIFIDDCSADRTAEIIECITDGEPHMRCVFHRKNVGRGGTVEEGFQLARGRVVGFIDIDLEVHCRYIPSMMSAIDQGADGATAYRVYKVQARLTAILRHILSRGYRLLFRAMLDIPFRDTETGYKFFDREAILPVMEETESEGWFWDTEIVVLSYLRGLTITEIPCLFLQRGDKKSTVRIFRDVPRYLSALWKFRRRIRGRRPPGLER